MDFKRSEDFAEALDIIGHSKNVKISMNGPVNGNYSNVHRLVIHDCNAKLIKDLIHRDFSLYKIEKIGLVVTKH